MMKCKTFLLILCFATGAAEATRDRAYGENCARNLYEQGTATGTRLSRRFFNTTIAASILYGGYRIYERVSFEPEIQVIYSVDEARRLPPDALDDRLIAATSAYDTKDSATQDELFAIDNGIDKAPAFRKRTYLGLIPFGTNVTGTLGDMVVALAAGEKVDYVKNLGVLNTEAAHRQHELTLLKRAFSRLEQLNYFATHFPQETAAAEVDKNIKNIRPFLFSDELKLNLDLKLKLKPTGNPNELELVGDTSDFIKEATKLTEGAEALAKLDDATWRVFYAGLAREWSAQLARNKIHNPMADFSPRISPCFLSSTTKAQYDDFIRAYKQTDENLFVEGLRKIIQHSRRYRRHVTLLAFDEKPHEIESLIEKLLNE